jgi:hypothetical protein
MGKLAHEAVAYYDGLPAELMTPQTQVYRGMALIREGGAQVAGKDIKAGTAKIQEARALFEKLRADGDRSEPATYGLALSLMAPYYAWGPSGGPGSKPGDLQAATDLLKPFAYAPNASRQVQITYADTLNYLSHSKENKEEGVAVCEEARKILVRLGALDLTDLNATSAYADTTDSQARHTMGLGRLDEAEKLEREVYDLAEKALAKRPGDLRSMSNRYFAADLLGRLASARHDYVAAERYAVRAAQAGEDASRFNPADLTTWGFWIQGRGSIANAQLEQGRIRQAIDTLRETVAIADDPRLPSSLVPQLEDTWGTIAFLEAEMGERVAADRAMDASVKSFEEFARMMPAGDLRAAVGKARLPIRRARIKILQGDSASAYELAGQAVRQLEQMSIPTNSPAAPFRSGALQNALGVMSDAALRLGRYGDAEAAARRRMTFPPSPLADDPLEDMSRRRVLLAFAVAKQGRGAEAGTVLVPAFQYYGREKAAKAMGTLFRRDYAEALYVSAIAQGNDPAGLAARQQALAQAAEVLSGASAEAKQTVEMRELASWIAEAR